jgi:hypothetical protein
MMRIYVIFKTAWSSGLRQPGPLGRLIGGYTINRFKCPACGGNQYTSAYTAEGCIYCGHQKLEKMDKLEPKEGEVEEE